MSEKKIRLSMSQKRIWYTKKLFPNDSIHTIGGTLYIDGKVDFPIINKAVNFLFETNEALRVDILEDNENVIQVIQDYSYKEIDFKDFSEMPNPEEEFKNGQIINLKNSIRIMNCLSIFVFVSWLIVNIMFWYV